MMNRLTGEQWPAPVPGMRISTPRTCAVLHFVTKDAVYYAVFEGPTPDAEKWCGCWRNTHEAYYRTLDAGAVVTGAHGCG